MIETAADGRIGIRFIDGTVFNLSRSTRVVLNEFVCDSNGTSHSALFGVTKGPSLSLPAGWRRPARLTVDTPVGSIRGRAHAGGFGMLSLTALTFSMMREVQAADPNATFLDDDSITYKDLEHGAFELVTKEAIPRHIIVEDPGETVVLTQERVLGQREPGREYCRREWRSCRRPSRTCSPTSRKGWGQTGRARLLSSNPLPVQPINFIQTDDARRSAKFAPPLPSMRLRSRYPRDPRLRRLRRLRRRR